MKLTFKVVSAWVETLTRLSGDAFVLVSRNGYYAVDNVLDNGGINNLCCGSLRECYMYVMGMIDVYNRIK